METACLRLKFACVDVPFSSLVSGKLVLIYVEVLVELVGLIL